MGWCQQAPAWQGWGCERVGAGGSAAAPDLAGLPTPACSAVHPSSSFRSPSLSSSRSEPFTAFSFTAGTTADSSSPWRNLHTSSTLQDVTSPAAAAQGVGQGCLLEHLQGHPAPATSAPASCASACKHRIPLSSTYPKPSCAADRVCGGAREWNPSFPLASCTGAPLRALEALFRRWWPSKCSQKCLCCLVSALITR